VQEFVPVILGFTLGVLIAVRASGRRQLMFIAAALVVSAVSATVLSNEYRGSWLYLLPDLIEAALGGAFGLVLVRRLDPTLW